MRSWIRAAMMGLVTWGGRGKTAGTMAPSPCSDGHKYFTRCGTNKFLLLQKSPSCGLLLYPQENN
jgi:uncharacterized protein YbbK (DUF523 family)